ncbi:hypothetical protein FOZ63_000804 [Perkinsus olseni]|uniref:Uncharacterized protein n=1 Tax=Perkinsus olseni TaxID=32597 RepID=A0A7J6P0Z8_PEROL|nr:hypothetical protein FOZ60_001635 [Perkinsus olseni]KAF4719016.1 hypothetical protein FOZ63_000804 [Perkinsus olseni]
MSFTGASLLCTCVSPGRRLVCSTHLRNKAAGLRPGPPQDGHRHRPVRRTRLAGGSPDHGGPTTLIEAFVSRVAGIVVDGGVADIGHFGHFFARKEIKCQLASRRTVPRKPAASLAKGRLASGPEALAAIAAPQLGPKTAAFTL